MASAEDWGEDFRYAIDTYDEGISAFATHYATTEAPRYPTRDGGELEVVSAGVAGWAADIRRMGHDVREGRLVRDGAWLLFPAPTVADPTPRPRRSPHRQDPRHAALAQPSGGGGAEPAGAAAAWTAAPSGDRGGPSRPSAPRGAQSGRREDPGRADRLPGRSGTANPHMWHGTFHGGDRSLANSGSQRPAPGWAQHRMPIPGLYQTGGTTHPGGR